MRLAQRHDIDAIRASRSNSTPSFTSMKRAPSSRWNALLNGTGAKRLRRIRAVFDR